MLGVKMAPPAASDAHQLPGLRGARVVAGLRQKEIACAIGVTVSAYSKWERGRQTPTLRLLVALLAFLGVPFERIGPARLRAGKRKAGG